MGVHKLTKRFIDSIPLSENGQVTYWDSALKGFGLRVGARSKTFIVQKSGGAKVKLGRHGVITVDRARELAIDRLADIVNDRDSKVPRITLREAAKEHGRRMARRGRSERSRQDIEDRFKLYLSDWLDRRLATITRRDVRLRHERITADGNPYAANNVMRDLRRVWNTAVRNHEGMPSPAPTVAIDWNRERRRQEPVTDLRAWWREVVGLASVRRSYQLFVLFTGLRRTDAATVRWEDVDLDAGTLHRPRPKGGEGRAFTVPLSRLTVALLRHRQQQNAILYPRSPWVFPANSKTGHIAEPKEYRQLRGSRVPRLPSPHRLRDTYASAAHEAGLSIIDIKVLMNHTLPGGDVTAGYVRQRADHLRECQERVTAKLLEWIRCERQVPRETAE